MGGKHTHTNWNIMSEIHLGQRNRLSTTNWSNLTNITNSIDLTNGSRYEESKNMHPVGKSLKIGSKMCSVLIFP